MNQEMMEVIDSLAKTNKLLVAALRKSHADLEDMKDHVANMAGPDPLQHLRASPGEIAVSTHDNGTVVQKIVPNENLEPHPEILGEPIGQHSTDEFKQLYKIIGELSENNAVHADRKLKISNLVATIEKRMAIIKQSEQKAQEDAQEYEDLAQYHKNQTSQFKENWKVLSEASRAFAENFNREGMTVAIRSQLDDMLSRCEVASYNT